MAKIRLSASRLKTLDTCSLLFYYENVLNLPSKTHPKTLCGSFLHSILENLRKPRHHYIYNEILVNGVVDYKRSKVLTRFVDLFQQKHDIPFDLLEDINGMLEVGLVHFDYWLSKAKKVYKPEYEFILKLSENEIKGIVDLMADFGDEILLVDWKSQSKVFTTKELQKNIQSAIYQLAIWKLFGKKSKLQFVMLRFPPNKLKPKRFIQEVPAKTEDQLKGVELYLEEMGRLFNQFTYQDALAKPCKDFGFCKFVCQMRAPFTYFSVVDKDNKLVKNYLESDFDKISLKPGEKVIVLEHKGCAKFY